MQSEFIFEYKSIFMCNPNLFLNARVFLRAIFCEMIVTIFRADEKISPKAVLIRFWGCFVTNRVGHRLLLYHKFLSVKNINAFGQTGFVGSHVSPVEAVYFVVFGLLLADGGGDICRRKLLQKVEVNHIARHADVVDGFVECSARPWRIIYAWVGIA